MRVVKLISFLYQYVEGVVKVCYRLLDHFVARLKHIKVLMESDDDIQVLMESDDDNAHEVQDTESAILVASGREVIESISWDFSSVVLVWCHYAQLRPDYLASQLSRYGHVLSIQDRWTEDSLTLIPQWSGFAVTYQTRKEAEWAKRQLQGTSRTIKTILLSKYLSFIVTAEICHPEFPINSSKIMMERLKLHRNDVYKLRRTLDVFGNVESIVFHNGCNDPLHFSDCVVTYRHVAQAYAAQFGMDGKMIFNFKPIVRVLVTEKENEILTLVKRQMQLYVENFSFTM